MKRSWLLKIIPGILSLFLLIPSVGAQEDTGIFPRAIITPKILHFPDTQVGTTSASLTVTISKTNSLKPLKIFRIFNHTPSLFPIVEDNCTNALLFNGQSCDIKFAFSPGRERHYFSFYGVINSGIFPVAFGGLKGQGVEPEMELSDDEIDFGDHPVGSSSSPHAVFLSNIGTGPLDVTGITSDNSVFTQTNDCIGTPIDPGDFCTISVTFTPNATVAFLGTITIVGDAPNSPLFIDLTGTGINPLAPAISVDKTALDFGNQIINTTSPTQKLTATNSGDANLTISAVNITGPFMVASTDCMTLSPIAPNGTCEVNVDFTPTTLGEIMAQLTFNSNASSSPTVDLSGTGIESSPPDAQLSQDEVDFGDQTPETSSDPVTVTMTNIGGAPIIGGITTIEGDNPEAFSVSDNCSEGEIIPPGGTCTFEIRFHPSLPGTFTAIIKIENNATNSPLIITLIGISPGPNLRGGGCSLEKFSPSSGAVYLGILILVSMIFLRWRKHIS